tara:strand:- start:3783 stop:4937 length:1155 start_codon:yes stop_codon:yes gene_type:complete
MTQSILARACQSGKTWLLIKRTLDLLEHNDKCIHIILTDNSLFQLEQMHLRIQTQTRHIPIVLNSNSDMTVTEITGSICNNTTKYILLCSNQTQIRKINSVLKRILDKCKRQKAYIWIDEADKINASGNLKIIDAWQDYKNIAEICYITATPHSLIIRYDKMNVMEVENAYNKRTYNKWSDNRVRLLPEATTPKHFIEEAFKKSPPKEGQIWFIAPGNLTDTHGGITRYLNDRGFYVLTINALGEILTTPNKKNIKMEEKGELANRIRIFYYTQGLQHTKFALVGYNRLGRGITIQSDGAFISHAVFPTLSKNKASIYQLAGRLCGNYKQYKTFKPPTVYCTEYFDRIAYESEDIVIHISTLPHVDNKIYDELEKKAVKKFNRR